MVCIFYEDCGASRWDGSKGLKVPGWGVIVWRGMGWGGAWLMYSILGPDRRGSEMGISDNEMSWASFLVPGITRDEGMGRG